MDQLETDLEEQYNSFKAQNESKNIFKAARTPAVYLTIAICFYILSGVFGLFGIYTFANFSNLLMGIALLTLTLWAYIRYVAFLHFRWHEAFLIFFRSINVFFLIVIIEHEHCLLSLQIQRQFTRHWRIDWWFGWYDMGNCKFYIGFFRFFKLEFGVIFGLFHDGRCSSPFIRDAWKREFNKCQYKWPKMHWAHHNQRKRQVHSKMAKCANVHENAPQHVH